MEEGRKEGRKEKEKRREEEGRDEETEEETLNVYLYPSLPYLIRLFYSGLFCLLSLLLALYLGVDGVVECVCVCV